MKKFLIVGALALTAAGIFHQHAFAWTKCHFSIGLNWSCQSGGNNLLWGVFRNGQPGCPDLPNCPHAYAMAAAAMNFHGPMMSYNYPAATLYAATPATNQPIAPSTFQPPMPTPVTPHSQFWYGNPGYQTVNFAPENIDWGFSYMLR